MVDLKNTHDPGLGPFPDVPEEIFSEIGCRLVLLQDLEMLLTFVTKVIFEKSPEKAKEAILQSDNKTMGQLLRHMRNKVELRDGFDKALKRTLDSRNIFVHEFSHIYNLRSEDGIGKAIQFLLKSMDDLEEVSSLLKAVIVVYGREKGVFDKDLETNWRKFGDLDQIDTIHIPKAETTFNERGE